MAHAHGRAIGQLEQPTLCDGGCAVEGEASIGEAGVDELVVVVSGDEGRNGGQGQLRGALGSSRKRASCRTWPWWTMARVGAGKCLCAVLQQLGWNSYLSLN